MVLPSAVPLDVAGSKATDGAAHHDRRVVSQVLLRQIDTEAVEDPRRLEDGAVAAALAKDAGGVRLLAGHVQAPGANATAADYGHAGRGSLECERDVTL